MEDMQITALYWARDEAAIRESDAKYGRMLLGIAQGILVSREDSEETVNDTYGKAWDSMPPNRPAALGAYLGRITRNLSISRWRAARARKRGGGDALLSELAECLPAREDVAAQAEAAELAGFLGRWLHGLPPADRALFLRRYWYCESVKALAAECGVSQSAMAGRLYRLRQSLKTALEKEGVAL